MHRNLRKGAAEKPPPEATEDVKFQALERGHQLQIRSRNA